MDDKSEIVLSEIVDGRTYVVAKVDHWPFKYWVGVKHNNALDAFNMKGPQTDGKRARTEDEAISMLADMVG